MPFANPEFRDKIIKGKLVADQYQTLLIVKAPFRGFGGEMKYNYKKGLHIITIKQTAFNET
jgi:hypothetical protein